MKKIVTLLMFFLIFTDVFSQITYKITEVKVNGNSIADGAPIEFGNNSSITVRFKVVFTKPENLTIGSVSHVIGTQTPSGFTQLFTPESLSLGVGNVGFEGLWEKELYASNYSSSGENYLVSKLTQTTGNPPLNWESNRVPILKEPTFTLNPTTLTLPCGDTSSKTFTVTPSNIPSGANVTYQWSHPGWNTVSSTSNSRTLQPTSGSSLPSTVTVTPYINGVAKPSMSCSVSRAAFSSIATISGNNYVCDTGTYTINSLPSNATVQSVSSSNTSIATVNLIGNNQFSVTKISDGLVTISATLQNSCSQTTTISKEIQIGVSNAINSASISGDLYICSNQNYTYTVYGASHPCITSYNWVVSPNLHIISQDANSITVSHNQSNNEYAGNIKYTIPGSSVEISKGVWVGVPVSEGLNIQKIGSYDFYAGSWTKLMATYITLMYEANGTYDLTYEWQIPNSMVRSFADTAYKDVNPRSSGQMNIGVRAWNECGCSEWKYKLFNVMGTGGGGPIELIPAN